MVDHFLQGMNIYAEPGLPSMHTIDCLYYLLSVELVNGSGIYSSGITEFKLF
ncbi:hypothetical protein BH23THE1_BH23THE1_00250 [soil metagenome]